MSREVDELFGEGGTSARPRTRLILAVLITGLTLSVLGMACSAVPGGMVTLAAWAMVEKEVGRVDNGYFALEYRPALMRVRTGVWMGVLVTLGLFILQGVLLCNGGYFMLWGGLIEMLRPFSMPAGV